ncbi:hypothetical protein RAE19_18755 [Rhodoferax sp. TBRC 17660]|jgi:hypothetical protein|uniref:Uncharacterized protein n=1 Tax=Rhodoferax potami TaxID=3068338 RepID=A0ABU3KSA4_9BURK|nr:hypothetical protein [Rhodoferax sp. TBRC 17660]MDT7520690.1 hypothetical protein [Rhodoferax sp. TBRC 17660]
MLEGAIQNMLEGIQKIRIPIHKPQQLSNGNSWQLVAKRAIAGLRRRRVYQGSPLLLALTDNLDVRIDAGGHALIDLDEPRFELGGQSGRFGRAVPR